MLKITTLLPKYYNDGKPIPAQVLCDRLDALREIAGGYTILDHCNGVYTMDNGDCANDELLCLFVVAYKQQVLDSVRCWAAVTARILRQESIYFEYHTTTLEFIRA